MSRRGFAMPMVIMLALVATVLAAAMLERQTAQRMMIQRQLRLYREHHVGRGVREVLSAWFNSVRGENLSELFGPTGHAVDIDLDDGTVFKVYVGDAQGALLTNASGLKPQEMSDSLGSLNALLKMGAPRPEVLRPVGPAAVSVQAAPEEVLMAIFDYATGGDSSTDTIAEIMEARREHTLADADLNTALEPLDEEAREIVRRMLTIRPELYFVTVEVYSRPRPWERERLAAKYRGYTLVTRDRPSAKDGSFSLEPLGNFLTWEEVPIDYDVAGTHGGRP